MSQVEKKQAGMEKSESLKRKLMIGSVLFSALAVTVHFIWANHWKVAKVTPSDWAQDANYTLREVPTTYYSKGNLSDILSEV